MAKEPPRPRPTASSGAASDPEGVRLNRFLASCGYGSRRKCEAFITEGRVEVNGEVAVDLATRVSPADHVRVDGKIVRPEQELTLLLNKPRGYLTTRDDPEERKTIYDLLPRKFRNLSYVGRLDQESQGLLLLTNSGSLNEALTHPRHRIEKEYLVALDRAFDPELIPRLTEGIHLAEGLARAESVRPLSRRRPPTDPRRTCSPHAAWAPVSYKIDFPPTCCSPRVAGPTGDYKFDGPGAGQRSWSRRRW